MLAYVTPARGVVLIPVTNFGIRDRAAATISAVNSSVGVSRKLERVRANPRIALAYHTRRHGWTDRPEYVLVQGRASLSPPHPRYVDTIPEAFAKYAGGHPKDGRISEWWLLVWHIRVGITLEVERIVVWPQLSCGGTPAVYGTPLPEPPDPQRAPAKGTGPRIGQARAARRAAHMPDALLGWIGSDGFPFIVRAEVTGSDDRGIALDVPPGLVPDGGRRAGFTAHRFTEHVLGQRQHIHTGWLEHESDRVAYAPHTNGGHWIPDSALAFQFVAGAGTSWGLGSDRGEREARRRGFMPD